MHDRNQVRTITQEVCPFLSLPWPRWNSLLSKISLYTVFGGMAFFIDYAIFMAVFTVSGYPLVANILGICGGMIISFTLNSRYNFRQRDAVVKRAARFVAVALSGMAVSSAIIALLIHQSVDPRIGKIVAMLVVFAAQFIANSLWTFR